VKLSLIPDAAQLWPRLWSVRLAGLSALLSAAEFALPFFAPAVPSRLFAALAFVVAIAAAGARVVAQPAIHEDAPK